MIGTILINIPTNSLFTLFNDNYISYGGKTDNALMLYKTGETPVVYNNDSAVGQNTVSEIGKLIYSGSGSAISDNNSTVIISKSILEPDIYLVNIVSLSAFHQKMNVLKYNLIIAILILTLFFMFMYLRLATDILSPLAKLHNKMKSYRQNI